MPKLKSKKQEAFCYIHVNYSKMTITNAAKKAGFSEKTAYSIGSELLKKPEIIARIDELRSQAGINTTVTLERVLLEMARLAFFDPRELYDENDKLKPIHELDDNTAAAICGFSIEEIKAIGEGPEAAIAITKKLQKVEKKGALDSLMKHLGGFIERKASVDTKGNDLNLVDIIKAANE